MAASTKRFTLTKDAYQDISEGLAFCSFRLVYLGQKNNNVRIFLGSALPAVDTVDYDSWRAPDTSNDEVHAHFTDKSAADRVYARADAVNVLLTVYRM